MDSGQTLLDTDLGALTADGLGAFVVEAEVLVARLQAKQAEGLAAFDAVKGYEADGNRSTAAWLSPRVGTTRAAAGARMKVARSLRDMPLVASSWGRGRLSYAKVQLFAAFVTPAALPAFERDQEVLVGMAECHTHGELRDIFLRWSAHADPEGNDKSEARRHRERTAYLSPSWAGGGDLRSSLTAEVFLQLSQVIGNVADEMRRADRRTLPREEWRTEAQLRHDALGEVALRAAAWKAEKMPAANPVLTLTVAWAALKAGIGVATPHGEAISAETAKRWACQAGISPLLFGPNGEPIYMGRAKRLFSPEQRRAIAARDGGCCWHGCNEPPEKCDAHHTEEWLEDDGPTDVDKGVFTCRTAGHHWAVHEGGFTIRRIDGQTIIYRPDGTILEDPRLAMLQEV
jgi:hypothetical protein